MSDNLTVLNSTGATFTLRMKDVGSGVLANMSVPTDLGGNTMVSSGATFTSTAQSASVVVVSSLSGPQTVALSSVATVTPSSAINVTLTSATVTLSSNPTVIISSASNQTVTSLTSGAVYITNGSNVAAVKASGTAPSSSDMALVVSLSPNGINPNGQAPSSNSAPVVISSNQTAVPVSFSSGTITLSSNPTVIPSSAITIGSGSVSLVPTTSGGLTVSSVILASGTNSTLVSSAPRQLYKMVCFNNSANIGYLHLYNLSSAPTVGSSLVFDRVLCPANASGAGTIWTSENGVPYSTGIGYTFTGGIADSDTTAVAAGSYIVNLYYK